MDEKNAAVSSGIASNKSCDMNGPRATSQYDLSEVGYERMNTIEKIEKRGRNEG